MGEPELATAHAERIGRYEILMQIAKGGMATVYLARAEGLGGFDRYVALKLTSESLRDDPEFSAHLIEEAKLVAHLRHLNVVPVLDVGECDRGVFLVMEYIPGDSLAGLQRRAREAGIALPPRVGLRVLVDALAGLHAAHEHADEEGRALNLVHRDFSPQNILVGTDGIARLTDFGIAKAASRASNTAHGQIKGKISYVAPEQAVGGKLDRRCDLWAAGVIAWELFAGKKLHGTSALALLEIGTKEPPRVRTVAADVPEALDTAIAAVLKIERDARTETAAAFGRELAAAAKAADLLADTDEVAELVRCLSGATLNERKERIAAARRQRAKSAPDLSVSTPSSALALQSVLPSLPDVPTSTLTRGVALPEPDFGSTPTVVPPRPKSAPGNIVIIPAGASALPRSEGAATPGASAGKQQSQTDEARGANAARQQSQTDEARGANAARQQSRTDEARGANAARQQSRTDETSGWSAVLARLLAGDRRRYAVYGGAALVGVGALVTALVLALGGSSPDVPGGGASSASAAGATSATAAAAPSVSVEAPRVAASPPSAPVAGGVWPDVLELTADAPIASVRVGTRVTEVTSPTSKVTVELDTDESGRDLAVVVTSVDGRSASATAKGGAVEVSFANAAPATRPAPRAHGRPPRRR